MPHVIRSSDAELDLMEIWSFIAGDDPVAADRQLDRIDLACRKLAQTPDAGPRREDLAPGLPFYLVGNYLIFYRAHGDGAVVVRVIHGARDYSHEFQWGIQA